MKVEEMMLDLCLLCMDHCIYHLRQRTSLCYTRIGICDNPSYHSYIHQEARDTLRREPVADDEIRMVPMME